MKTQLQIARAGIVSEQVQYIAQAESVDTETLRKEVAAGRVVIFAI